MSDNILQQPPHTMMQEFNLQFKDYRKSIIVLSLWDTTMRARHQKFLLPGHFPHYFMYAKVIESRAGACDLELV